MNTIDERSMQIEYLADHPQHIPALAAWHHGQWGHWNPQRTVEIRCLELKKHLQRGQIPTTFVALEKGSPIGSASLRTQDLSGRPELSPWLASVYVESDRRREGIGRALVLRVMQEAADLGVAALYLFTPDRENFYTHLGWTVFERTETHGDEIVIMTYDCAK